MRLVLSPSGLDLVSAVTARRRREIGKIIDAVPSDERDVLVRALRHFAEAAGEVPEQDWTAGWDL